MLTRIQIDTTIYRREDTREAVSSQYSVIKRYPPGSSICTNTDDCLIMVHEESVTYTSLFQNGEEETILNVTIPVVTDVAAILTYDVEWVFAVDSMSLCS
jgi:hypothetical protein